MTLRMAKAEPPPLRRPVPTAVHCSAQGRHTSSRPPLPESMTKLSGPDVVCLVLALDRVPKVFFFGQKERMRVYSGW